MAGKIFVNYRRSDTLATAGRLYDRLAQTFGRRSVFMDVDKIPAGVDFTDHLKAQVEGADAFLVIIGPGWLGALDEHDRPRISRPDDFVAIEIAAALQKNIRVIPVLVDGANMPRERELPDLLKGLARRNAVEVRNTQFGRDADMLVGKVREAVNSTRSRTGFWVAAAATAAAAAVLAWIGLQLSGVPASAFLDAVRTGDVSQIRHGKLRLRIPSGLIGSNFWLYVDGQLKTIPPRPIERFEASRIDLMDGSGVEFWDQAGMAVRLLANRPSHVRPGIESRIFQTTLEFSLPPGDHPVELLTEDPFSQSSFPFRSSKLQITVATGATIASDLWSWGGPHQAAPLAADYVMTDIEKVNAYVQGLSKKAEKFDADPIARQLSSAAAAARSSPPSKRTLQIDVPWEPGPPREVDAAQIAIMIDALARLHSISAPSDSIRRMMAQSQSHSPQLTFIDAQFRAHNKRIEELRELVRALQRVR